MKNEPYVKLSRIRDYGIGDRGPDNFTLNLSELDDFSNEQLAELRDIFKDEIDDIDYQIAHEQKHLEHDVSWHYGAKSSKKARYNFIRHIDKILSNAEDESELNRLRTFHRVVSRMVDSETFACLNDALEKELSGEVSNAFDVTDI
jgi:hypothetical protein